MSTAIIGKSIFASELNKRFLSAGAGTTLISVPSGDIRNHDILLLADEPFTFIDIVTQISPFMKPGQTILIGSGSIFGTWAVSKALYEAKAPSRIIVGMCDAFDGNPECKRINLKSVRVSAHSFVYNQFLSYLTSELFEDSAPAASPLAISLSNNTLGCDFSPIAEAAGMSELTLSAMKECVQLANLLGNEHASPDYGEKFTDLAASLHAAICNLYPLCKVAEYLSLDVPALNALLRAADEMTAGDISRKGAVFTPKPEQLFGHDHG